MAKSGVAARRIRPRLLVLLWIWAACVFTVVDLFRNVGEFDGIRPRARLYRAVRWTAHEMVGEPYLDEGFADAAAVPSASPRAAQSLGETLATVDRARTQGDQETLEARALQRGDARVRIAAMAALAERFQASARKTLSSIAADPAESDKVRRQAARWLGSTGGDALWDLEALLCASMAPAAREGAVLGLAQLDMPEAAERLLALAKNAPELRGAVAQALGMSRSVGMLACAAADRTNDPAVRAAACRGLGNAGDAGVVPVLSSVLGETNGVSGTRAAAAAALGVLLDATALPVVQAMIHDASPDVAREARRARTRLLHVAR